MTSKSAWFPLYIGDYQADTMHLTCEQHGAYFLLMLAYYRRGRALPDDDGFLAGVTKTTARQWTKLRPSLAEFFAIDAGMWRHKRIDAEIEQRQKLTMIRAKSGSSGARSRWQNSTKSTPDSMANPSILPSHTSHTQFDSPIGESHRARTRASPQKITSPAMAWYEGAYLAAQSYIERHRLDNGDDSPADGALLDGRRVGNGAA